MLWTGGKDSCLALHEAAAAGCQVVGLVTFAPPRARFLAHPLRAMRLQAQALGLAHEVLEIDAPYDRGYEAAIRGLARRGIETVVTGDIAEVDGRPNWVRARSAGSGLRVWTPLWGRGRRALLERLLRLGVRAVFSLVRAPAFDASWVGRELDRRALRELRRRGVDLCGENGEYHTLVLDAPLFTRAIELGSFSVGRGEGFLYMKGARLGPRVSARPLESAGPGAGARTRVRPGPARPGSHRA